MTSGVNRDPLPIRTSSDQFNMADKELTLDVEVRSCEKEQNGPDAAVDHSPLDKKILLKLDLVVLPVIAMLYLLVFIDRANVGNARVAGLQKELKLSDLQYSTAVSVTYVLYIMAELPSNLLLRKIGPRILLPGLCFAWGLVTCLQCLVNNYSGLLGARLLLGLAEGGLFPGINLYLSMFYRRDELQLRIAVFYSFSALSGAFSGLLAAAISKMHGLGGLSGWQWIFCLEGLFTCVFAPLAWFLLPNNPHQMRFFTEDEASRCSHRLQAESMFFEKEKVTVSGMLSVYKSLHIWPMFIAMVCLGVDIFGLAFFTPSIVSGMGFSPIRTQLMTVPPFALGFVICVPTAYISDRYRKRGLMTLLTSFLSLIGVLMFYKGRTLAVRYTSLFFLIAGVYASGAGLLSWVPNNTAANTRRATAIATAFCCTNAGGLISTWIFPTTDAPYYPFASKFILSMVLILMAMCALEMYVLSYLNRRKEDPVWREKALWEVAHLDFRDQIVKLGDAHPDYKYIL